MESNTYNNKIIQMQIQTTNNKDDCKSKNDNDGNINWLWLFILDWLQLCSQSDLLYRYTINTSVYIGDADKMK